VRASCESLASGWGDSHFILVTLEFSICSSLMPALAPICHSAFIQVCQWISYRYLRIVWVNCRFCRRAHAVIQDVFKG